MENKKMAKRASDTDGNNGKQSRRPLIARLFAAASQVLVTRESLRNEITRLEGELKDVRELVRLMGEKCFQDTLCTDTLNRRGLDKRLQELSGNALRRESPVSIIVFDVDYFKNINDGPGGHAFGDLVLKTMASKIREIIRSGTSIVARLGGDEFLVALEGDVVAGKHVAGRIRDEVSRLFPRTEDVEPTKVTISCGVAAFQPREIVNIRGPDPDEEFLSIPLVTMTKKLADDAAYVVKRRGRNGVAFVEETENGVVISMEERPEGAEPRELHSRHPTRPRIGHRPSDPKAIT